LNKVSQLSCL